MSRFGYDGKGQVVVSNLDELKNAFEAMNRESHVSLRNGCH